MLKKLPEYSSVLAAHNAGVQAGEAFILSGVQLVGLGTIKLVVIKS